MPQVEDERLAAEAIWRDKEAYLKQLYTSFVPLWGELWEEDSEEAGFELEGAPKVISREERGGRMKQEARGRKDVEGGSISSPNGETGGSVDGLDDKARGQGRENSNEGDRSITQQRPTMWWRGADAPHIWRGPSKPTVAAAAGCHRSTSANGKLTPGARFVPAERALLDGFEPQAVSVGRLSREYLTLLGLPHESIRDMYEKASVAVL